MKSTLSLQMHWQLLLAEYAIHNYDDFKSWLDEQELEQGKSKQITDAVLEFINPNDP